MVRGCSLGVVASLLVLVAGCEQSKTSNPLSPTIAGPIAGVTIEAPGPIAPAAAAEIPYSQQPLTLTVTNAQTTGVRPVSYVFEIAADQGFTSLVFSKTGVPAGDNGTTSMRMTDYLPADRTYFWRATADDGANKSDASAAISFRIYTPVVIQAPGLRSPSDGAAVTTRRPTLVAGNAARTGPAGAMQYLFEIATDGAMSQRVASGLVGEGSGQTSFTPANDLAASTRHYWRVRAMDAKTQGQFSEIWSFVTPAAAPTFTPNPPTSGGGGSPAAADQINMSQASILNSPVDLAAWPITTALTTVDIRPTGIAVEFSKKDGSGRWPDITPPGWSGPLQYTLGMCLFISNRWYCSAVVEFWHGLAESGGPPQDYAKEWFYDPSRWAPMTGHQPAVGETIGFFVCAGDCRNNLRGDLSPAKERSNVVLVKMPGNGGATYRF